jgi:hypothetical protein
MFFCGNATFLFVPQTATEIQAKITSNRCKHKAYAFRSICPVVPVCPKPLWDTITVAIMGVTAIFLLCPTDFEKTFGSCESINFPRPVYFKYRLIDTSSAVAKIARYCIKVKIFLVAGRPLPCIENTSPDGHSPFLSPA